MQRSGIEMGLTMLLEYCKNALIAVISFLTNLGYENLRYSCKLSRQDIAVTELSNELDEEVAHLLKEDVVVAAQSGERLLGNSNQQLFRVNL